MTGRKSGWQVETCSANHRVQQQEGKNVILRTKKLILSVWGGRICKRLSRWVRWGGTTILTGIAQGATPGLLVTSLHALEGEKKAPEQRGECCFALAKGRFSGQWPSTAEARQNDVKQQGRGYVPNHQGKGRRLVTFAKRKKNTSSTKKGIKLRGW